LQRFVCTHQGLCPADNIHQHPLGAYGRFMQINLPVHQPSGIQEIFYAVYPFFFYDKLVVVNIEHCNNAVYTDRSLLYTCEKAIALQIIKPVDIQLTGDKLVKELSMITIPEKLNG
jgi:hypothetical protein